ncbi:MAG: O-methyltransferase [Bacteroidales bacterium]|nr:O-methyltransferase [Bacteroidales bacterium]MDD6581449.1 O-methyltransferase [Bacteroidales bacterium]
MHAEITEELEEYCEAHSTPESDLLYRLNRETNLKCIKPRMISGHLQGRLLSFISQMMRPKRILEIGTYTGYATLCLAEGLTDEGRIDTIEIDEELEEIIRRYFSQSDYKEKITLHVGDALQVLKQLDATWDLVFMDAEKDDYIAYYELVMPRLRQGGIILADNVLWSGKVIQTVKTGDKETRALMKFNDYVLADERVKNFLLPFRDGIMVIEKL